MSMCVDYVRLRIRSPLLNIFCGPLAQRLEQGTHNSLVIGSNPVRPTNAGLVAQ